MFWEKINIILPFEAKRNPALAGEGSPTFRSGGVLNSYLKSEIIKYNQHLKPFARKLRKGNILSEALLWDKLKNKQLFGYKFLRQKPIDNFIVDFFCKELMLAIEIDGSSHNEKAEQDLERQKIIESQGIRFLRFQDKDVRFNMDNVLKTIEGWVKENEFVK